MFHSLPAFYFSRIMYRLVLLVCLVCFGCSGTFSREAEIDTVYNTADDWLSGQYADLPDWIFATCSDDCVISFSDPCMTLEKGREQAVMRAVFIYSLRSMAELKYLNETFSMSGEYKNGALQRKNKITSLIKLVPSHCKYYYRIEEEYTSIFNEVFLKVKVVADEDVKGIADGYTLLEYSSRNEYMVSFLDDNYEGKEFYINSEINGGESDLKYNLRGSLRCPKIKSCMDNVDLYITGKGCWHKSNRDTESYKYIQTDMINSFWNAYVLSFAEFLFSYPYSFSQVKLASEYNSGGSDYNDNEKEMSRMCVGLKVRIKSQINGIYNNKLYVDWNLVQVE